MTFPIISVSCVSFVAEEISRGKHPQYIQSGGWLCQEGFCLVTCCVSGVSPGSPLVTITGHRAGNRRPLVPAVGKKPPSGSIWSALVRGLHYKFHNVLTLTKSALLLHPLYVGGNQKIKTLLYLHYFFDRSLWCGVNWTNPTIQGTFVQINGSWLRFCRLSIFMCQRVQIGRRQNKLYWAGFYTAIFSPKQRWPSEIGAQFVSRSRVC